MMSNATYRSCTALESLKLCWTNVLYLNMNSSSGSILFSLPLVAILFWRVQLDIQMHFWSLYFHEVWIRKWDQEKEQQSAPPLMNYSVNFK